MEKLFDNIFHCIHTEPIAPIDQWRSSLRLFDEISKKMWLLEVESFNTSLGYDTAVVGLDINKHAHIRHTWNILLTAMM